MNGNGSGAPPLDPVEAALFNAASELTDLPIRAAFLSRACAGDAALRTRIEALLAADARAQRFMADDPLGLSGPKETPAPPTEPQIQEPIGSVIGRYRLLKLIGEGGMGVVYLAEQQEPVRRRVALKIIKPGMDTCQVIARFEAERQALALMDHPNIAKVLDGGAVGDERSADSRGADFSPQGYADRPEPAPNSDPSSNRAVRRTEVRAPSRLGRPYFVMELVEGLPITEFCAREQLTLEQRLRLFIPVCQAVQHAHQKGIIHRDLKPSNVMVTLQDGVPAPKVIDFGVAKALNQRLTEKTLFTQHATLIGTPAYMSPEQAEMSGLDVDTRSDIYSLGVLLYELLTGTQPFPEQRLRSVAYAEMQRIILHEEPERPSTRLSRTAVAADVSRCHLPGTGPVSVDRTVARPRARTDLPGCGTEGPRGRDWIARLRGDLDWIVLKCLEKDRNRRYETANGLAMDLHRHLDHEPVLARSPSAAYRLRKLVRRNRTAVVAGVGVGLALIAGLAVASWQAARAERLLLRTLDFVDQVYSAVGSRLQNLIGGATAYHMLMANGVDLLDDLRAEAGDGPAFRLALAQLETQLAFGQAWFAGNTAADYEAGYATITNVLRFLAPGSSESVGDQRLSKLARAEMVAGYAALELDRPQQAFEHFRAWDGWARRLAGSTNAYFAAEGRKYRRWASGSMGEALYALDEVEKAMEDHWIPSCRELEARGVSSQSTNWVDLHDYFASANSLAKVHGRFGQAETCVRHRREAVSLAARLTQLFPHSAQDAAEEAIAQAELGASLLASPRADAEEGRRWLEAALAKAQQLMALDRANLNFIECRIKVLRLQAEGLIKRACLEDTSPTERRTCLDQASACLHESDGLFATLPRAAGPSLLRTELGRTRAELAAATARSDHPKEAELKP